MFTMILATPLFCAFTLLTMVIFALKLRILLLNNINDNLTAYTFNQIINDLTVCFLNFYEEEDKYPS